jgi:hypothetical protein
MTEQIKAKKLSLEEFQGIGFLQELNRTWAHPLGLVFAIRAVEGKPVGIDILRSSEEEGPSFGKRPQDAFDILLSRKETVDKIRSSYSAARKKKFGYEIQPLNNKLVAETE